MAASEVHKHFHRECEYHCTSCPRCSVMVLCRDVGEHLRASCNAHAAPQATECEAKPGDAVVTEIIEGAKKVVQEEAGEMKALLERAFAENVTLNDSLTEVSHSVNIFKESVKQEIASEVSKQTREVCQSVNSLKETVSQGMAPVGRISDLTQYLLDGIKALIPALNSEMVDIKKQNAEEFPQVRATIESAKENAGASAQRMLELQKKALAYAEKNVTRCDFFIPGVQSLVAKALEVGETEYLHGQVYLRGYNISPGVRIKRNAEAVSLDFKLQLHRGDHDDVIQWPFEHKVRFTIVHPRTNEEKVIIRKTHRHLESFKKPTNSSNNCVNFTDCFKIGDLQTCGYVCDDKLRILVELL